MSCIFLTYPFLLCLYCTGLGEILAAEMRNRIMVLDGAMGTMIQSYYLTEEQFRGLSPPLNFSLMFWFCLCSQLHIFFCLVFSRYRWRVQGSSQESQRQQWSTLSHSTSCHLWDTQGMFEKMGTCSAHALLLIDAYIVTIWPHTLPVNVLFVSTSLLIVSFSLEILWSRSWFCRNQHLQWNQCIPGWLWDRASGEGLSLTHSLKCNLNFYSCN